MIYCGKCKELLTESGHNFSECKKCGFEVYEVSSW